MNTQQSQNEWKAQKYDQGVGFVAKYGENVIELLNPKKGERILDLGCGTGHLTKQISEAGCHVIGIDYSENMIAKAIAQYPEIEFSVENGESFQLNQQFDAVFSNAALHWMKNPQKVITQVHNHLVEGGRFVLEMGGKNNCYHVIEAIYQALEEFGVERKDIYYPWYFPSLGEYTTLLEEAGFEVSDAHYFHRETHLYEGLESWIENFAGDFLQQVPTTKYEDVIKRVIHFGKESLYNDGKWYADYKRLRVVAWKK